MQYSPESLILRIQHSMPARRLEPADNIVQQKLVSIRLPIGETTVEIGQLEASVLNFGALAGEGESLAYVCDAHSEQLFNWAETIFTPGERFRPTVCNALKLEMDIPINGSVYLDSLYIQPAYRGSALGQAALHAFVKYGCMGCETVFLKAFPCAPEGTPRPTAQECDIGRARLRELYAGLGFRRIGRTDYMGLNLDFKVPDFLV